MNKLWLPSSRTNQEPYYFHCWNWRSFLFFLFFLQLICTRRADNALLLQRESLCPHYQKWKKDFWLFSYFHYHNVAVAVLFKIVNPNFFSVQETVSHKRLEMLNCLKRCQTLHFILLCVPPRATLKWKSCLKRVRWSDEALKRFHIAFPESSPEATQAIQKTQFKHWVLCIYVLVFFFRYIGIWYSETPEVF